MPTLVLVAGPNGSGKSTISASSAFRGQIIIDPDAIARRLNPTTPRSAAIAAAREAIERCRSLLQAGESFVLESTLAGNGAISVLRLARGLGYQTILIYVALADPGLNVERVLLRVAQGGHDIPDADIRRRYFRSLSRAPEAMRLADETLVLDNGGTQPERSFTLRNGRITWRSTSIPLWAQKLVAELE